MLVCSVSSLATWAQSGGGDKAEASQAGAADLPAGMCLSLTARLALGLQPSPAESPRRFVHGSFAHLEKLYN